MIAVVPNNSQETLITYLNSITSNIQFTFETENNQKLPYLDILIIRNSDGSLKFDIYRKPSYTGKLLDYNSSSHLSHKRSTVKSLLDRAFKICSPEYLQNEISLIKKQLIDNNYPKKFIQKEINKCYIQSTNNNHQVQNPDINNKKYIATPYVSGTNERIQRILSKYNIFLGNKSSNTIKNLLVKPKDKVKTNDKCNIVYKLNCNNCNVEYIGETGRNLCTRMEEHERDVRIGKENSQVYHHSRSTGHSFGFQEPSVLHQNSNVWYRRRLESFYTINHPNSINRAYDVTPSLIPIVNNCK